MPKFNYEAFNYEAEVARVSASQAYEMNLNGTMSSVWTWGMNSKWKHVKAILNPNWRCPHCGFLSFGYTDIEQLGMGVAEGRQCCNIVLEAVRAWHQYQAKSLDGARIFAWELGYSDVPGEMIGCSVVLRWPHEEVEKGEPWRPSHDATINIFRSGMLAIQRHISFCRLATDIWLKRPGQRCDRFRVSGSFH